MSRRTLLVIYTGDDWHRRQPHAPSTQRFYDFWAHELWKRGITVGRASITWWKSGRFQKYWLHSREGHWKKVTTAVTPYCVYDLAGTFNGKTGEPRWEHYQIKEEIARTTLFFNPPSFSRLIDDKLYQPLVFHDAMPESHAWFPGHVVKNPTRRLIVLKKRGGSGGQLVTITRAPRIKVDTVVIEQEFIEAKSKGELKDYRIAFVGTEPIYAYNRIAKPNSLYTNVFMGASMRWVNLRTITPLLRHAKEVAAPLAVFPKKVFTLDFLISKKGRPYLIEANTMPGTENFPSDIMARYVRTMTKHFFG
jgi:glutathione synthase/RimK-type ligase-like ATP-grasp enzyme